MATTRAVRASTRATRTEASSRSVRSAVGSLLAGCGGVRSMGGLLRWRCGGPGPVPAGPPQDQRSAVGVAPPGVFGVQADPAQGLAWSGAVVDPEAEVVHESVEGEVQGTVGRGHDLA
jgi:hypothetical protein